MTPTTVTVPVSDPAHPSHTSWLEIIMTALRAATIIGPAVVTIVSPANAQIAQSLGSLAGSVENQIPTATN